MVQLKIKLGIAASMSSIESLEADIVAIKTNMIATLKKGDSFLSV